MTFQDKLKILNENEKTELLNKLREQFGIAELPGIIIKKGKERLFYYNGSFKQKDLEKIESKIPVERAGLYLGKIIESYNKEGKIEEEIRLSIEGTQILGKLASKNVFELNDKQAETWMMGEEILIKTNLRGFTLLKNKDNFIGCGKASENKITNFIPKSRRLKNKNIIE